MRKILSFLLILIMISSSLSFSIYAASGGGRVINIKYDNNYALAVFDTIATKGTSQITFGTHGWNISFSGYSFLYQTDYDPSLSIHYEIPLVDGSGSSMPSVQSRIKSQKGESSAMYQAFVDLMATGGTITFNAHIQKYNNDKPTGQYADTLSEALSLASWGDNTKSEFETEYYNRNLTIAPQPVSPDVNVKADFQILYKGKDIAGNYSNPALKAANDLKLVLLDCSTVSNPKWTILKRVWYYWDVKVGWVQMSQMDTDNDTTIIVEDMDTDLPGSQALKKAFKLEVTAYQNTSQSTNPIVTTCIVTGAF